MQKTDVEIANEVLDGKWGIGKEREKLLTEAGYDYNIIQGLVNHIVKNGAPIKEISISKSKYSGLVVYVED